MGDMLRCLGDILAFFSGNVSCIFVSGKMSERHVKMSWRHLGIFQGKCLRDMFRCLGDFFLTGKMPERYVKICGRHLVFFPARCLRGMLRCLRNVKVSERQFGIFFRQDVCVPC